MRLTIILLDMLEISRLLNPRHIPIEVLQPAVEARVAVSDTPEHELEVLLVDGVEADEGRVELDVGFCGVRGGEDVEGVLLGEEGFEAVEGLENDAAVGGVV